MQQLFLIIKNISKEFKDLYFIFKEHPSSIKSYPKLHKQTTSKIFFANGNTTQELIENAKAIITVNSTVGIEALLFKKRVIILGDAFYKIEDITKWATNKNELINILKDLDNWKIDNNLIENFLKYLHYDYLTDIHKDISCFFREEKV